MKSGLKKCVERSGENDDYKKTHYHSFGRHPSGGRSGPPGSEGCIKPVIGRDDVRRRLSLKRNGIRREGYRNRVLKGERKEYWGWDEVLGLEKVLG